MKKIILFLSLLCIFFVPIGVYAAEDESMSTDASPVLAVTDFTVDTGSITAGKTSKLAVTLTNKHKTQAVHNIKLTFTDVSGSVLPLKLDSIYVDSIAPEKSYTWCFDITATDLASGGAHAVSVMTQYETENGQTLTSSDNITLQVIAKEIKEVKPDESAPKLMVTAYTLDGGYLMPDEKKILKVTLKNMHTAKRVCNIKLSLADESGDITPSGMGTAYVNSIGAGGTYTWEIELTAAHTSAIGEHRLTVSAEYEDSDGRSYGSTDTLRLNVRQSVKLQYDNAILPKKVISGDTQTVTINLMNTGKSTLYNCTVDFDIEHLQTGGSTFVGNIEPAQSGTAIANLRVGTDTLGEVKGKIIFTYEDDYGESYTDTVDVSTVIEEKVTKIESSETEQKQKHSLWWLFVLIGFLLGGAVGFGIPWIIKDKKQRKEDDLRL